MRPTRARRLRRLVSALRRAMTFSHYYHTNHWADAESRSGPGSRQDSPSVQHALKILSDVTDRYAICSLADIPCGDFNWISAYLMAWPQVDYTGFDIVAKLVKRNQVAFPSRKFARLDIVVSVPPPCDLIFCKDLLNHLESSEIVQAIANMRLSGSRYLLASNNFGYVNEEMTRSRYISSRHVDLTAAPYRYPQPLWHDHYLGLWKLADMERPASFPGPPGQSPMFR
jgi:hypothetical protein